MFRFLPYTPAFATQWDSFVETSKNGTFLLQRGYMDYHADRFADRSLLVYKGEKLFALLPACLGKEEGTWVSHGGLTYGGIVLGHRATTLEVCRVFDLLLPFLRKHGAKKLVYRPTPWIYHRLPAEEDLYALTMRCHARLTAREVSSAIALANPPAWSELRRRGAKKAEKAGIKVEASNDLSAFWKLLESNLMARHGVRPVHTLEEMQLLHKRFPKNIHLLQARATDGETVAGTILYLAGNTIHAQYISASPLGRKLGALDAVFHHALDTLHPQFNYFDFGKSTEAAGTFLNEGLIAQKEGFGARALCYDTYEVPL